MNKSTKFLLGFTLVIMSLFYFQYKSKEGIIIKVDWIWWENLLGYNSNIDINTSNQQELAKINFLTTNSDYIDILDLVVVINFDAEAPDVFNLINWSDNLNVKTTALVSFNSVVKLDDNGLKLSDELYESNLLKLSFYYKYNEDLSLKSEDVFQNGELVMTTRWAYYDEGQLKNVSIHNLHAYEIKSKHWYKGGQEKSIEMYASGMQDGRSRITYENGNEKENAHFLFGQDDESFSSFYETGSRKEERYFLDFEPYGTWKTYHENGKIASMTRFLNGSGGLFELTKWDESGEPIPSGYKEVIPDQILMTYYDCDDAFEELSKGSILSASPGKNVTDDVLFLNLCKKNNEYLKKYKRLTKFEYKVDTNGIYIDSETEFTSWYKNGEVKSFGLYDGELKQGFWMSYDSLGRNTKYEWFHNNGVKKTEVIFTYRNSRETQLDDKASGWFTKYYSLKEWDEYKNLRLYKLLRHGKIVESTEWYGNGQIMQDGNYVNSLKDGKWIYYRSDGSIQKVVNYQNGEKEGEAMSWYLNGNKEIMENYSLGLMHGKFVAYRLDGKLEYESTYVKGVKHGISTWWGENGKKTNERNFENGVVVF